MFTEFIRFRSLACVAVGLLAASAPRAAADCGCSDGGSITVSISGTDVKGAMLSVSGSGGGGLGVPVTVKMEAGGYRLATISVPVKDPFPCPEPKITFKLPCGIEHKVLAPGEFATSQFNTGSANFGFSSDQKGTTVNILVLFGTAAPAKDGAGSESGAGNPHNTGGPTGGGGRPPSVVITPGGSGGVTVGTSPAVAGNQIPLGFDAAANGSYRSVGMLALDYLMGSSSLGIGTFQVRSQEFNPSDPASKVRWVTPDGNPRILLSPEGAFKVTELTDSHPTDPSRGAKVEAFARTDFNAGTSEISAGVEPLATYLYSRAVGGLELTVSEWIGVAATGDPTKVKEYKLVGTALSESSGGIRTVKEVLEIETISDPTDENDIRGASKKVVTAVYKIDPVTDVPISRVVEEYGYIPVRDTTGGVFGGIVDIREVLKARWHDLTVDGLKAPAEPGESWYYYGEETGSTALPVADYALLGREKLHVMADGNWRLSGFAVTESGDKTVVFEPWMDTAPPNPAAIGVVVETPASGLSYPLKRTVTNNQYAAGTDATPTKIHYLSGPSSTIIGEEENSGSGSGSDDITIYGKRATHRREVRGTWAPNGDAYAGFTQDESGPHKMVITTEGLNVATGPEYDDEDGDEGEAEAVIFVVPAISTQEIVISAGDGPILRETRILPGGASGLVTATQFQPATRATYSYDAEGRLVEIRQDNRVTQSVSYESPTITITTDEQGVAKITETDSLGRVIRETTEEGGGVAGINRTIEYNGLTTIQRINGVLVSEQTLDLAGRIKSETDQTGATTGYTYEVAAGGGTKVTKTLPGGVTRVTTSHRDGRTQEITGTGTIPRYYEYGIQPDVSGYSFQLETERTGGTGSARAKTTVIHWKGMKVKEIRTPNASTDALDVVAAPDNSLSGENGYSYQSVTSGGASAAGNAGYPADTPAGAMGMHTISGPVQGWSGIAPTPGGQTRLVHNQRMYVKESDGYWYLQSTTTQGLEETSATRQSVSKARLWQGDGGKSISSSADGVITTQISVFNRAAKSRTDTTASNRSAIPTIVHQVNGYIQWQQGSHSSDDSHRARFVYDDFGRVVKTTDHRGGTTRTVYNAAGQVEKTVDTLGRATSYSYLAANLPNAGRTATITKPNGSTTTYTYNDLSQLTDIGGTAEYPQQFTYNSYGDPKSLRTTRANGAGTAYSFTLWDYNATGLVRIKYYNQTSAVLPPTPLPTAAIPSGAIRYTYDAFGRQLMKEVGGGKRTVQTYNIFGELLTIHYGGTGITVDSPGPADVTLTRDNAGQVAQAEENYVAENGSTVLGGGTTTYTYAAGRLDKTEYNNGHSYLSNVKLDYKPLDYGRSAGYEVFNGSTRRLDVGYGYDIATGRLAAVGSLDGSGNPLHGTFTYSYHPGSGIVSGYTGNAGGTVISQSRPVDFQNRIAGVVTKNGSGQVIASVAYSHDAADRRIQTRREDGSYWSYGYTGEDGLATRGEITSSERFSAAGAKINGLENRYSYDDIGNRKWAKFGGGATGALSQINYTVNGNNQYTTIARPTPTPGKAWVVGRAPAADGVQVNAVAAGRQDTWFSSELTASNSAPLNLAVTVKDGAGNTIPPSGSVTVPAASATPTYDLAGNLVTDGRWTYEWDSENRLRKMTSAATGFPNHVVEFVYDWQGRRIAKKTTLAGVVTHKRYLYEGWNVLAEWTLTGSSTTFLTPQTYLWGLDLGGQNSGDISQLQSAGGVGGLLAASVIKTSDGTALGNLYAAYDGNGNILAWSAADGSVKRSQDYDAFGNIVLKHTDSSVGAPLAAGQGELSYGFSTKPRDAETGLLYYGYRYYDPVNGRWPSRDPIEESGGINLYAFLENDGLNKWDYMGMANSTGSVDISFGTPIVFSGSVTWKLNDAGGCQTGEVTVKLGAGLGAEAKGRLGQWGLQAGLVVIGLNTSGKVSWCRCDDGSGHISGSYDLINIDKSGGLGFGAGQFAGASFRYDFEIGIKLSAIHSFGGTYVTIGGSGHGFVGGEAFIGIGPMKIGAPAGLPLYDESYEKIWWEKNF